MNLTDTRLRPPAPAVKPLAWRVLNAVASTSMMGLEITFIWVAWEYFPDHLRRWFSFCPYFITLWLFAFRWQIHYRPLLDEALGGDEHDP